MGVFNQTFHAAIEIDEFFSSLISNTWQSRNVVHGISFHAQKIDDLNGIFDFKFSLNFLDAPSFITTSKHWAVHKYIRAYKLCKIFIWGHHKSLVAFFFGFFGQGSYDVISFIAFFDNHGNVHGFQKLVYIGHSDFYPLRSFISIGFVFWKNFYTVGASTLVKANG